MSKTRLSKTFQVSRHTIEITESPRQALDEVITPWFDTLREEWMLDENFDVEIVTPISDMIDVHLRVTVGVMPFWKLGNCQNCGRPIEVAIFRGEDWCSDDCRKALGADIK